MDGWTKERVDSPERKKEMYRSSFVVLSWLDFKIKRSYGVLHTLEQSFRL